MSRPFYDICAIGNLTVDLVLHADDAFIARHGLTKGVNTEVSLEKLQAMTQNAAAEKTSGGPATNIVMGVTLRGGRTALIGKIDNDDHGVFFTGRVQEKGVDFTPVLPSGNDARGTSVILVLSTPDKERSFASFGGAAGTIRPADLDEDKIKNSAIVYIDSYMSLTETGRETALYAAALARRHGRRLAIAINDRRLVAHHRDHFMKLAEKADIILGDRYEFAALLGIEDAGIAPVAATKLRRECAITAGKDGAFVVTSGGSAHVPAQKVENVVDTSGAGDQFAAGYLFGRARGMQPVESAKQGASWAAQVIQHTGAEPRLPATPVPGAGFRIRL